MCAIAVAQRTTVQWLPLTEGKSVSLQLVTSVCVGRFAFYQVLAHILNYVIITSL